MDSSGFQNDAYGYRTIDKYRRVVAHTTCTFHSVQQMK